MAAPGAVLREPGGEGGVGGRAAPGGAGRGGSAWDNGRLGEALPQGIYKGVVRTEVRRLRVAAEEERRRREERAQARRGLRDPLERPRRPPAFPGPGGRPFVIGGPHDLEPGGFPRFNPFGGGGGGGFHPRFH